MKNDKIIIWSSTASADYWYDASDEDIIVDFKDFLYINSLEDDEEYADIIKDNDIDAMRDILYRNDTNYYDLKDTPDYEDLVNNIIPEVADQCYDDDLWVIGNYQRWDGSSSVFAYGKVESLLEDICYPNYDAKTVLYDDNGDLTFTEYTHDTPMGGTNMTLYSFKDKASYDAAIAHLDSPEFLRQYAPDDYDESESTFGELSAYDLFYHYLDMDEVAEEPEIISEFINKGWLTPVSAKIW